MKYGEMKDIINDYKHGGYDFTVNGKCSGCGNCCSNLLPMTENDVRIIKKYIKEHNIKEQTHFAPRAKPIPDYTCPFLVMNGTNKKCSIYLVRPIICREFICSGKARISRKLIQTSNLDVRKTFFGKDTMPAMVGELEEMLTKWR